MSDKSWPDSGVHFARASIDFEPSERVDKAKKAYLFYFAAVLLIGFAGATIHSANLVVSVSIRNPEMVQYGLWIFFAYSMVIYYLAFKKDIELFIRSRTNKRDFLVESARISLRKKLEAKGYSLSNVIHTKGKIEGGQVFLKCSVLHLPAGARESIGSFHPFKDIFIYDFTAKDVNEYKGLVSSLKPSVRYNYLTYLFPLQLGVLYAIGFAIHIVRDYCF